MLYKQLEWEQSEDQDLRSWRPGGWILGGLEWRIAFSLRNISAAAATKDHLLAVAVVALGRVADGCCSGGRRILFCLCPCPCLCSGDCCCWLLKCLQVAAQFPFQSLDMVQSGISFPLEWESVGGWTHLLPNLHCELVSHMGECIY